MWIAKIATTPYILSYSNFPWLTIKVEMNKHRKKATEDSLPDKGYHHLMVKVYSKH